MLYAELLIQQRTTAISWQNIPVQVGPKTDFLRVDIFSIINGIKDNFVLKKYKICMLLYLNILSIVCISVHYMRNYTKYDKNAWILPNF